MKNFVITDKMAKGFATEIENNIEKINSKGGMPFLNYVLHLKGGKTEQISESTTRMCVTLSLLPPFKMEGITDKKKRGHVIFKNGKVLFGCARDILRVVVDAVENFEYHLERFKSLSEIYNIDSMLGYKLAFKEVVEKYGFEDLEKRIADFFEYLTNLGGSEDVEVEVEENDVEESAEVTEEDVVNEVVGIINANLIDDATEGQKLDWSLFNDNTMEYLFANGGPELYEKIKNGVKSRRIVEVLAYDDCFYVWYDEEVELEDMSEDYFKRREEQRNLAIELAEEDYDMKNYKERENYEEEDLKNYLANMLGRVYAHRCLKDDEEISIGDVVYMVKVFMEKLQELRGADLEYDALVLAKDKDMRVRTEFYEGFETMESEIMIALLNAKIFDAKCVAEGLNRMYWDTIIWENDDVAVKYTSPCEDFERGCLLVVEKESECMLGGWIDVSSNQDAVEHVVEEIERYFGEVRIVTK